MSLYGRMKLRQPTETEPWVEIALPLNDGQILRIANVPPKIAAEIVNRWNDYELALGACRAAVVYDAAIQACANEPEKMASFCTAEGDDLDSLYADWIAKARLVAGPL